MKPTAVPDRKVPQRGACVTGFFSLLFCMALAMPVALATSGENGPHTLSAVQQSLAGTNSLYAEFEQVRSLKLLQRPLISRGTLQYRKSAGICWQLKEPVPATVYLNRHNVSVSDSVSSHTVANSNPALQLFSDLLFSVFAGDIAALENRFDLAWKSDTGGWQLTLQPRDALMTELVSQVAVSGQAHIRQVHLVHKGGDQTTLNFHQVAVNPDSGSATSGCEDAPS